MNKRQKKKLNKREFRSYANERKWEIIKSNPLDVYRLLNSQWFLM